MKKIILTEGTEFEQNMKDMALIDTDFREGKPTMIDSEEVNEAFTNSDQAVKDKFNFDLNGEEINITPSTSQQVITPSQGKNAITKATVAAVTSSIDSNIVAGNIKKDVSILGVTGTLSSGPEIIPVVYDSGETLYKTLYLKKEDFTIPYSAELAEEINNVIAEAESDQVYTYIQSPRSGQVTGRTVARIDFISGSDHLDVVFRMPKGLDDVNIMKYTFTISGETISVTCDNLSEVSALTDNTNGLYIGEYSGGYPALAAPLLYSTSSDVIES